MGIFDHVKKAAGLAFDSLILADNPIEAVAALAEEDEKMGGVTKNISDGLKVRQKSLNQRLCKLCDGSGAVLGQTGKPEICRCQELD